MAQGLELTDVLDTLKGMYPVGAYPGRSPKGLPPEWERDPFHVLISTVLSQRTKDANTRVASDRLFTAHYAPMDIASTPVEELASLIRPAGFPRQKAKAIKEISRIVHEDHGDVLPSDMDALLALPMVGRKTANCTLAYGFGIDAVCVDVHVHRICNRLGVVRTNGPDSTEEAIRTQVPQGRWKDVNRLLVRFGQTICLPRNPRCEGCPFNEACDYHLALRCNEHK